MLRYDFFECGRGVVGDRPKNWGGGFFGVAVSFTPYPLNFCFIALWCWLVCGVGRVGKWSGLGCIAFVLGFRVGGLLCFLCLAWVGIRGGKCCQLVRLGAIGLGWVCFTLSFFVWIGGKWWLRVYT